jgi:hypothetical protein
MAVVGSSAVDKNHTRSDSNQATQVISGGSLNDARKHVGRVKVDHSRHPRALTRANSCPQRRRTWRANGCEFGGADISTFALLAEPDPMVPVPCLVEEANERTRTDFFLSWGIGTAPDSKGYPDLDIV